MCQNIAVKSPVASYEYLKLPRIRSEAMGEGWEGMRGRGEGMRGRERYTNKYQKVNDAVRETVVYLDGMVCYNRG